MPLERHPPVIRAVGTALPKHYATQEELIAALRDHWGQQHFNIERLEELHRAVQVDGRHLSIPLKDYPALKSFGARNQAWLSVAVELGEAAIQAALEKSGRTPQEIDHIFFTTVTGISVPSVDARLINRIGFRPDIKRTPLFGLGCVGGAAGLARASDYLRAFPKQSALLLSVELCSLTLQQEDLSITNIIASGLFGDGAAAVVLDGADRAAPKGPSVVASRSVFYPGTERVMGWDVVDGGFKIVLSAKVPSVVQQHVGPDVDSFLKAHDLSRGDIRHWVVHTGGPKVLEAFESSLALPADALKRSWQSLRQIGNLSSASVLFVLSEFLADSNIRSGEYGLLMAMGPGFCSELVLLRW